MPRRARHDRDMIDDRRLRTLAATQRSLVTVDQARDLGYDRPQRHRLFDGRRWARVTPRVARLSAPWTASNNDALIAVLDAGSGGALGGFSAGAWWGIPGNQLEPFHVVRLRDRSNTPVARPTIATSRCCCPATTSSSSTASQRQVPARALFDVAGTQRRGARAALVRRADGANGGQRVVAHAPR